MSVTLDQHLAGNRLPLVAELVEFPDPIEALSRVIDLPRPLLLESARTDTELGRYSFLMADPFRTFDLQEATTGDDPFFELRAELEQFQANHIEGLPPFQGGAAGLFSYELGHAWEKLPHAVFDEFQIPAFCAGLYDWVIAWDHREQRCWIISHGFSPSANLDQNARAKRTSDELKQRLSSSSSSQGTGLSSPANRVEIQSAKFPLSHRVARGSGQQPEYVSNFSEEGYLEAVTRVQEYITDGDIFQANLSQRLLTPQRTDSLPLYSQLRTRNPAPFAAYYQQDDWFLASSSPERFVQVQGKQVSTRPIKGTRQRRRAEADLFTRDELRQSEKDRSENVMIVDLLRNDLSRVCRPGTIHVPDLCRVEMYETVQHLVSEVRGELQPDKTVWDLIAATFPGGSITGAPKIRAMQVITELETTARGPYCGSLFYSGFNGHFDSSILIRTLTGKGGWIQLPVGGGIVIQSDPLQEYEETMHKAAGMRRALGTS
ncbi:Aminodeoxychorismate synthase component 1 [Polystyrenella longa]|uniref:Aminodeoxychorismate synthase component 1 n=1 Tax=Polystyrenella longa TaxID=2528007 RepID=A0A518CLV7_9PLAN|nr:anthranilate synthase component I family protein [Polystyrenella longa]QDU80210.1 Aminodeoxychorismate synthase component 1 [Polystyrenella longa]